MFRIIDETQRLIGELAGIVRLIERHDADLGCQIRRAATSIALNLAEGSARTGKDRLRMYRIARGSALEVLAALTTAVSWRHLTSEQAQSALEAADTVCRMSAGLVAPR